MLTCFVCEAQIKPVISGGSGALLGTNTHGYQFLELQGGAGIVFNEKYSLQLNYMFVNYRFRINPPGNRQPMKTDVLSISLGYRVLGKDKIVSPTFVLDLGVPIHSNADSAVMYGHTIYPSYSEGMWRYNRGLFFGKLKALCDIQLQAFNLQFGVSFNQWYFNMSNLKPDLSSDGFEVKSTGIGGRANFGIEAGLMYTLPSNKRDRD